MEIIQNIDNSLMFLLQDIRNPVLNSVLIFVTTLGNAGLIWLFTGLVLAIIKRTRMAGISLIVCVAVCYVFNDLILKELVSRPRPFLTLDGLEILVKAPSSWSFPSGHSCSSFVSAYVLTYYFGRRGALSYILAALIAISRPYVGVHYPSDILVGAIIGTVGAFLCLKLIGKIHSKCSNN